jgi:hypothetical protein
VKIEDGGCPSLRTANCVTRLRKCFTLVGYPYGRKVLIFRDQFLRVMNLVVRKVCDEIDCRFLERFMHDNRVSLHGFFTGG